MMSARSLNKVMLIGNLTRDPELRQTTGGAAVCTFGLATNSVWKTTDGVVEESTEFHNIVCWNKLAEICSQLLKKGMKVYVEGELRTRTWDDETGNKRWKTEIKISDMILLDNKGKLSVSEDVVKAEEIEVEEKTPVIADDEEEEVKPEDVLF